MTNTPPSKMTSLPAGKVSPLISKEKMDNSESGSVSFSSKLPETISSSATIWASFANTESTLSELIVFSWIINGLIAVWVAVSNPVLAMVSSPERSTLIKLPPSLPVGVPAAVSGRSIVGSSPDAISACNASISSSAARSGV